MSVLTRYVTLGHQNADPPRVKTMKSILVVVVVAIGLLNLNDTISAYVEGQTLNIFVQGYLVGVCLLPLALLAMGRGIASVVNWTFLAWLPNIVFVLLIYGNRGNGAVYLLLIPLGAVFVFGLANSRWYLALFLLAAVGTPTLDTLLPDVPPPFDDPIFEGAESMFRSPQKVPLGFEPFLSITVIGTLIYFTLYAVMTQLNQALGQIEGLVLNILPADIVDRLREMDAKLNVTGETHISDEFDEATILFADIVGFTALSQTMDPAELVAMLNEIFTEFDERAERHGVEKIKTIGDAYMAVAGLPVRQPDHARRAALVALEMLEVTESFGQRFGATISLRIGINSGPVVAGVIGRKKFLYDLWGDAVNTASRMESHGEPGAIQVTESTYTALKDEFHLEKRPPIEVKGKGMLATWWLRGVKGNNGGAAANA